MYRRADVLKAFALALFIKNTIKSSTINDFSYNKLHIITGLHITTLKKRIETLKKLNLISYEGRNKQHLCIKSIISNRERRNYNIQDINFNSVKDIEDSLYIYLFVEIQRRKDFVKHTIEAAHNGHDLKTIKRAKRLCRRYGYDEKYHEFGLSYKTIAKKLGICIQKAFRIVKLAVEWGFVKKYKRIEQIYCRGIKKFSKYLEGDATFFTKDNAYIVLANAYSLQQVS